MSRKSRITAEEKIQVAQDCIEGRISQREAARRMGVDESSIRRWIARYEAEGGVGLQAAENNRPYNEEEKRKAVVEYLTGAGSLREICKKYKIRSDSQLRTWVKVYNSGRNFKHKMSGGSCMKSTRKTTQEERVRIAKECIENGDNYGEIAIKYQGYIDREKKLADKILRLENIRIPEDYDFSKIKALSIECRIKLERYRPRTIAQASRISGVSPADISVLLVHFGR